MENPKKYWSKAGIIFGFILVIVNILFSTVAYNDPAIRYPEGWSDLKVIFYPNVLLALPVSFLVYEFMDLGTYMHINKSTDLFIQLFVFLSLHWFLVGTSIVWIYNKFSKIGKILYLAFIMLILLGIAYLVHITFSTKPSIPPQPLNQQEANKLYPSS